MRLPFTKMHGLGNDFVLIDDFTESAPAKRNEKTPIDENLARALCDRRRGVGCDQLLWIKPAQAADADLRMDILNNDGSVAEMCGNGIRAVGLYLHRYWEKKPAYRVETLAGIKTIEVKDENRVVVDMGPPTFGERSFSGEPIEVQGQIFNFHEIGMGNPHAVLFVDDAERIPAGTLGPIIERLPRFPKRTNVEFVEVRGPSGLKIRVWERGAGLTEACGTGACAAAVAALALERVKGAVRVELPGGVLTIRWREGEPVMMEGPAAEVFRGEWLLIDVR